MGQDTHTKRENETGTHTHTHDLSLSLSLSTSRPLDLSLCGIPPVKPPGARVSAANSRCCRCCKEERRADARGVQHPLRDHEPHLHDMANMEEVEEEVIGVCDPCEQARREMGAASDATGDYKPQQRDPTPE